MDPAQNAKKPTAKQRRKEERKRRMAGFSEYHEQLTNIIKDKEKKTAEEFIQEFARLQTNPQRVDFVLENMTRYKLLDNRFTPDVKSDKDAKMQLRKGQNSFSRGENSKALGHWTRATWKAVTNEVKAKAYGHRSAALFKLGMLQESLVDVERALEYGYPDHMRPSLYLRRAKAKEMLASNRKPVYHEEPPGISHRQRNRLIRGASNSVEIRTENNRRRVFATKDIQPGEVIAVEKAYAWNVSAVNQFHCNHCLTLCYNLIPCLHCRQVGYCSADCRDAAWQPYHKFECPIQITLKNVIGRHKGFALALKMTFLREHEVDQGAAADTGAVNALIGGMRTYNVPQELYACCLVAGLIFNLVKNFSPRFQGNHDPKAEEHFKDLLVQHIQLIHVYGGGIEEGAPNPNFNSQNLIETELMAHRQETVGCALFSFYPVLSHSCCANTMRHHHGLHRVLRAARTIKKGQELFASYGVNYVKHTKQFRQERCQQQYFFTCTCKACKENWSSPDERPYFLQNVEHVQLLAHIRVGSRNASNYSIPKFLNVIKTVERYEHSSALVLYQKLLSYCYDILGNRREIP